MLPFMKPKELGAVIQARKNSNGKLDVVKEEGSHSPGLLSATEDLIRHVHNKDVHGAANALKAFHEIKASEDDTVDPPQEYDIDKGEY